MNKRIEKILENLFDDQISEDEGNELISWIKNGNRDIFNEYIMLNYSLDQLKLTNETSKTTSWKRIEKLINQKASTKVIPIYQRGIFKYAAAILILISIGTGYFLTKSEFKSESEIVFENDIKIGADKATLTLEDGSNIALEKGKKYISDKANSDGEKLIYSSQKEISLESPKIAYNYLTVPRGGEFFIELADDTKVWLNADSKLKYPVKFIEGQPRQVELVYGEAYFDVSPSYDHNGDRFNVISQGQHIEVLGTRFNVKAYKDDVSIETVLEEGKIVLKIDDIKKELIPNQQLIFNKDDNTTVINQVDAQELTSWRTGNFKFSESSFLEVSKVLSRWFDVEFHFENEELENMKINGAFSKYKNIEGLLLTLKNTVNMKYKIEGKDIYIQ